MFDQSETETSISFFDQSEANISFIDSSEASIGLIDPSEASMLPGFPGEGGVTAVALVGLVRAVRLDVASQRLLVLEPDPALGAGVGLGVLAVVQLLVHSQVVLAAEGLGAVGAGELVVLLVRALVSPEAV